MRTFLATTILVATMSAEGTVHARADTGEGTTECSGYAASEQQSRAYIVRLEDLVNELRQEPDLLRDELALRGRRLTTEADENARLRAEARTANSDSIATILILALAIWVAISVVRIVTRNKDQEVELEIHRKRAAEKKVRALRHQRKLNANLSKIAARLDALGGRIIR